MAAWNKCYGFSFVRAIMQMQVEKAAQIVFMGFGIDHVISGEAGLFLRGESQLDFIDDRPRDFVLEAERIPEVPFVAFRQRCVSR